MDRHEGQNQNKRLVLNSNLWSTPPRLADDVFSVGWSQVLQEASAPTTGIIQGRWGRGWVWSCRHAWIKAGSTKLQKWWTQTHHISTLPHPGHGALEENLTCLLWKISECQPMTSVYSEVPSVVNAMSEVAWFWLRKKLVRKSSWETDIYPVRVLGRIVLALRDVARPPPSAG